MSNLLVRAIEELIPSLPDETGQILRKSLAALDKDKLPDSEDSLIELVRIGAFAATGKVPPIGMVISGILAMISIVKELNERQARKIAISKRDGTAAGLAAYHASKLAGPKK